MIVASLHYLFLFRMESLHELPPLVAVEVRKSMNNPDDIRMRSTALGQLALCVRLNDISQTQFGYFYALLSPSPKFRAMPTTEAEQPIVLKLVPVEEFGDTEAAELAAEYRVTAKTSVGEQSQVA